MCEKGWGAGLAQTNQSVRLYVKVNFIVPYHLRQSNGLKSLKSEKVNRNSSLLDNQINFNEILKKVKPVNLSDFGVRPFLFTVRGVIFRCKISAATESAVPIPGLI